MDIFETIFINLKKETSIEKKIVHSIELIIIDLDVNNFKIYCLKVRMDRKEKLI